MFFSHHSADKISQIAIFIWEILSKPLTIIHILTTIQDEILFYINSNERIEKKWN